MKQPLLTALFVLAIYLQAICAVQQRRAPISASGLEENYRQGVRNASKSDIVVGRARLADDRSWEKKYEQRQAERRAERAMLKAQSMARQELLDSGKYFDDGRGNIKLKKGCRYDLLVKTPGQSEDHLVDYRISGFVTSVRDGDTICVKEGKLKHEVRLRRIDAPETSQPFGIEAASRLKSLIYGMRVLVEYSETDQYGRIIGTVYLQDTDINLLMVRSGFAWHYKQYDDAQSYAEAEAEAKSERRGLWMDETPVPPWEFRRMK